MDKCIDVLNDCDQSFEEKIKYISNLDTITVIELIDNYENIYIDNSVALFMVLRSLQHPILGLSTLEKRYGLKDIQNDIVLFSHIDQISIAKKKIRGFMLFMKRKQRYSLRYLPQILSKSSKFSNFSPELMAYIGEKYLGIPNKNIDIMANRLGVVLAVIDNIKRCHIEYYYKAEIWEEMADQPNQQGLIEAEEDREVFMRSYQPSINLVKWVITPNYYHIKGDFSNLFVQYMRKK